MNVPIIVVIVYIFLQDPLDVLVGPLILNAVKIKNKSTRHVRHVRTNLSMSLRMVSTSDGVLGVLTH